MKRKDFLKGLGLAGLGIMFPKSKSSANIPEPAHSPDECVLIPTETAGPFPLDLTDNTAFFRQDIREQEEGVLLNLRLKIKGLDNCEPMQNVRVHIWHCDKNGVYSGYNTGSNPGDVEATHLRGYQITDAHGEVAFTTVFPGIYPGRICHIHFQVHVSSSYAAVSQLTFPIEEKNALYLAHPDIYPNGADPLGFENDFAFADNHELQVASLQADPKTGIYHSYLEVSVQGSGTTGIGHLERATARIFELGQNFPNPYHTKTVVPYTLKQAARIRLQLFDLSGKQVAMILDERKAPGTYQVEVVPAQLGLVNGHYIYQLEADNGSSIYRMAKQMTHH
jgi:hypothetical protein